MKTSRVVGPKAWRLIRALNAYDDFRGAVLDVVDEAAALSTTPAPDPRATPEEQGLTPGGEVQRATLTLSPKFGPGLWLDNRLVARIVATVEDSRVSPEEPEPRWLRDARVFVHAVNALSLDAAWAAVEAALPEGWRIEGVMLVDTSDDEDLNVELVEWEAEASSDRGQRSVTALGPTPAAALLALADKLRESQP